MPNPAATKASFSQRHPILFGLMLLAAAMALFGGAMAAFHLLPADKFAGARLGVVRVEGLIVGSEELVGWIGELERDDSIKGVLLRIDSPGGVVAPSQEVYSAVLRLAERKPVIASMGAVAASGGYYVAAAAREIVANPSTLTGSIGVRMELLNIRALAEKVGLSQTLITSGEMKGAGTPFREMSPREREYLTAVVMDMHDQFVNDIAQARGMEREQVAALADGRAFTGRQAHGLGLVDHLGGMEDAMDLLRERCGLTGETPVLEGPIEEKSLLLRVLSAAIIEPASEAVSEMASAISAPRWVFLF
ncbi:signal peptide peptidase A [Desulfocurvibacter africanus PCS]|uniref:Signal peptide peptidase A n=1 Tax=Desulfocurvibacter africanus PCS TaxID=1262666 RepID=M5PQ09_DESAF|nr:signal peptide peptidase A [Desulfocurvibacter africanus PCS]